MAAATSTRAHLEDVLKQSQDGDVVAASEIFAEDGVFVGPHAPEPEYRGPEKIREALRVKLQSSEIRDGTARGECSNPIATETELAIPNFPSGLVSSVPATPEILFVEF